MDAGTWTYISEPSVSEIFKKILKSRLLSYYQLETDKTDSAKLKEVLTELQQRGLIEKKAASFTELDKYFPTQEGLEAEKYAFAG